MDVLIEASGSKVDMFYLKVFLECVFVGSWMDLVTIASGTRRGFPSIFKGGF